MSVFLRRCARVRSAGIGALLLVAALVGLILSATGCRARERRIAADDYTAELQAHRQRFQAWEEAYPGLEARLAKSRRDRPEEVVRIVEGDLLGLLGALVEGYGPMVRKGRRYVALLPPSVKAREAIGAQLDAFQDEERLLRQIHQTYEDEAALFRKGRPDSAALQEVWSRRLDAARQLERGEGD